MKTAVNKFNTTGTRCSSTQEKFINIYFFIKPLHYFARFVKSHTSASRDNNNKWI